MRQLTEFTRITVFCTLFLLSIPAFAAAPDYTPNDSCTNVASAKTELGDLTYPIDSYTSETVSKYFSMTNVPCTGTDCSYCSAESSNTVKFCYNTSYAGGSATYNCSASNVTELTAGNEVVINGSWFQAVATSSEVCVQVLAADYTGWITLGCKSNISNTLPTPSNVPTFSACFVDGSCGSAAASHTKSKFAITSVVVECIQGTLSNLFFEHVPGCERTLFSQFKAQMERIVWVALTLYVIFYGIRITLGERPPASGEVFIFVIKMALVIYFSVGGGVEDFLYEHFIDIMNSLTKMMFDAGSVRYDTNGQLFNRGLCNFASSNYEEGYKLLALFDSIDCRLASYLFINPVTGEPQLLAMIIPAILTARIIFVIFALIFALYLLSITVYVVHNFIMSIILLNLIMYFAPLFVPMALFSQTKKFYDSWVRSLLFGSLQPIVLFGFVTLMLTVFDQVFYADCTFISKPVTTSSVVTRNGQTSTVTKTSYYFIVDRANANTACKRSMGYSLSEILNFNEMLDGITQRGNDLVSSVNNTPSFIEVKKEFVTAITFKDKNAIKSTGAIAKGMMILALFAFLFYHFVEVVFSIAENLIGGPQNRSMVSTTPMGIANKAGAMTKDAAYTVAGLFIKPEKNKDDDDDKAAGTNRRKPTDNDWHNPTPEHIQQQMEVNAPLSEMNAAGESVAKGKLSNMTDKILKKAQSSHEKFDEAHRDAHKDERAQKIQEVAGLSDNPDAAPHVRAMMNINAAISQEAVNRAVIGPDKEHVAGMQSLNKEFMDNLKAKEKQSDKTIDKVITSHEELRKKAVDANVEGAQEEANRAITAPDHSHVAATQNLHKELRRNVTKTAAVDYKAEEPLAMERPMEVPFPAGPLAMERPVEVPFPAGPLTMEPAPIEPPTYTQDGKAQFTNVDDFIATSREHNITAVSLQVNSAEDLTKLASFLETDTTLKSLDINRGFFGTGGVDIGSSTDTADAFRSVTDAIGRNSTLTDVTISGHHITNSGMEGVSRMLQSNSNLKKLDLTHSSTSLTGLSTLSSAISDNKSSLTHLTLNNLSITDNKESNFNKMGDTGAKLLARSLESNSTLQVLNIRAGDIKSEGMEALAAATVTNATLTHLDLGLNWGGDRAAAAFTETLKTNTSLKQLDLSRNDISQNGVHSLTESGTINHVMINLESNHNDSSAPTTGGGRQGPTPAKPVKPTKK